MTEQADKDFSLPAATKLEDMSPGEMAADWVQKVAAVSTLATDSYIITEESVRLSREARAEYNAQFDGLPLPEPEEAERRNKEWRTISQEIIDADPRVIEKNKFLAMLTEQDDPGRTQTIKLLALLRKTAEDRGNQPMTYLEQFLGLWAVYKAGQASEPEAAY
jgi:hypothetical protein